MQDLLKCGWPRTAAPPDILDRCGGALSGGMLAMI
jgi:hypothetical protein